MFPLSSAFAICKQTFSMKEETYLNQFQNGANFTAQPSASQKNENLIPQHEGL